MVSQMDFYTSKTSQATLMKVDLNKEHIMDREKKYGQTKNSHSKANSKTEKETGME